MKKLKSYCFFWMLLMFAVSQVNAQFHPDLLFTSRNLNIERFRTAIVVVDTDKVIPEIRFEIPSHNNPSCVQEALTVSVTHLVNGGSNPIVDWFSNQNKIASGKMVTLPILALAQGDTLRCRLISNHPCVSKDTVWSAYVIRQILPNYKPSAIVSIIEGNLPTCSGEKLAFELSQTGLGSNPQFNWQVNNVTRGVKSIRYRTDSLKSNQSIRGIVVGSLTGCNVPQTDTSKNLIIKLQNTVNPIVSFQLDSINNPDCDLKKYHFSAKSIFGGPKPIYTWLLNEVVQRSDSQNVFRLSLKHNDVVKLVLNSSTSCALPALDTALAFIRVDTLVLPYFEDFTKSSPGMPIDRKWVRGGGTNVNNGFANSSPSANVLTFDGLDENGDPYELILKDKKGFVDSIASAPIQLQNLSSKDSVYFSFQYQPWGRGELPDTSQGDRLELYFRDAHLNWIRVWSKGGDTVESKFRQVILPIVNKSDTIFYHKAFQFCFKSYGKKSGPYDTWNLDYIYLNSKRNKQDIFYLDRTWGYTPTSLFKKYTSIPLKHAQINPTAALADQVESTVNNLSSQPISFNYKANVYDYTTQDSIARLGSGNFFMNFEISKKIVVSPNKNPIANYIASKPDNLPLVLQSKFVIQETDSLRNRVDFRLNDTVSNYSVLDNYYAYDDGTAEYAYRTNIRSGRIAYRFVLLKPDTLKQIAFYFSKIAPLLPGGSTFKVVVYDKKLPTGLFDGAYVRNVAFQHNAGLNKYWVHTLVTPVILTDTFYIGFQQQTDTELPIGLDANTDSRENIFVHDGYRWNAYDGRPASLMMRPVFGFYRNVVGLPKDSWQDPVWKVFPNPALDHLTIESQDLEYVTLYDLTGKIVQSYPVDAQQDTHTMQFSGLNYGVYLLKAQFRGGKMSVKRIILSP